MLQYINKLVNVSLRYPVKRLKKILAYIMYCVYVFGTVSILHHETDISNFSAKTNLFEKQGLILYKFKNRTLSLNKYLSIIFLRNQISHDQVIGQFVLVIFSLRYLDSYLTDMPKYAILMLIKFQLINCKKLRILSKIC
ncbi:hypothetical protein RIR_jg12090.t1 [Rhizophagus irregularis DAOM 181602=DAOM 197198]|nr:hypothetical protein RIR_jg12090.t1 [Rhizophagus irregularis DAOM 181602=DAOM 197198]